MKHLLLFILFAISVSGGAQVVIPRRIHNTTEPDRAEAAGGLNVGRLKMVGDTASAPLPHFGSPKVPVILVQFKNKKFSVADTDEKVVELYDQFFNAGEGVMPGQAGHESACSVREYFRQQSCGKFTPEFSVYGPVTLSEDYEYYGGNNNGMGTDRNIGAFYSESCKLAVQDFQVDWTEFDNKNNGRVGFVFFIYAGKGENTTWNSEKPDYDPNNIWPKEGASSKTISYDGKSVTFGAYGCTSEMYQEGQDGIGVTVHELGHGLGLPDVYDVNYSVYNLFGMDMWDVMDSGCYAMESRYPSGYTAYERDFMGWLQLVTLDPDKQYTLTLEPFEDGGVAYKLPNKANANEYLVLENRQNKGMDAYLGCVAKIFYDMNGAAHGLLVTHIDYSSSAWIGNRVNTSSTHQRMTIVPADGELISNIKNGFDTDHYVSLLGDIYPGSKGTTELTSYAAFTGGQFTFTVDNIRETADGKIILDINGGDITAIDEIESGSIDDDCYSEIYSIAGIRLQSLQKGINIVKTADGKLKKVLR